MNASAAPYVIASDVTRGAVQNTEMDSHEEKLHKMIIQSKVNDTKDIMKRKAMEIDKSKVCTARVEQQSVHAGTPVVCKPVMIGQPP